MALQNSELRPSSSGPSFAGSGPSASTYDAPVTPLQLARRLGVDPESIIKLDANENPYGPPPAALRALASVEVNRYPDAGATALRERVSQYVGCEPERLVFGNGSDELIDLLCRAVLRPGDRVVNCPPTFGMYAIAARASGSDVVDVPRDTAFDLDWRSLPAACQAAKLVFLCSPNNPTGGKLSEADLRSLLAMRPLVVLDEAYVEYAGCNLAHLIGEYSNLVILRTFSKAFGLAGLRVGYGIFPPDLARALSGLKAPYNVSSMAQAAAVAALDDTEWVERHAGLIRAERDRVSAAISALPGLDPLPSDTNFLLVRVSGLPASKVFAALLDRGIMVRWFQRPPLHDYLRITTGTPQQNDALLAACAEIMKEAER
jgi:histidinol-phosphate aminotransferase